jgi:hypothetical protein
VAERRMTEVDHDDLVEMIDRERTWWDLDPSSSLGEQLADVLKGAGWCVVRPIQQEVHR